MPNALTRHVGFSAGAWVVETLVKHYFEHVFGGKKAPRANGASGNLREDELLYDEVFHIVKSFLDASTHHTVEELQRFSNTRTPSAPWMYVVRALVPMSCCESAATYLIEAMGGEEKTKQVVGGTKWWQVRGLQGVDAQWIVARKDYHKAKKRRKEWEKAERERRKTIEEEEGEAVYRPEMDEMGCILYFHGGGYYFGSVDQERYFLQRFARKSGCRLLAINYRLAPQYPFPCAIQDGLAAYLYLIQPPPDARHAPVHPEHIVVSGDSAGGGLTLALLQVLRDSGLPLPAGGIPISPWCDLTHSFPSIHLNTDTDIIPKYGLSMHKPSILWPPPSDEVTERVHDGLRKRIKQVARRLSDRAQADGESELDADTPRRKSFLRRKFGLTALGLRRKRSKSQGRSRSRTRSNSSRHTLADDAETGDVRSAAVSRSRSEQEDDEPGDGSGGKSNAGRTVDLGSMANLPSLESHDGQTITLIAENGEKLEVKDQVQLYAPNNLLNHPLVSSSLSYLGGLPPLLIIASDAEVLRDEVIYAAHKAAHPDRHPIKEEARKLYPKLEGIDERYGPTKVHLQVYDQTTHVMPVLFSFCTPAKFCFRSLANFTKYVTGTLDNPNVPHQPGSPKVASHPRLHSLPNVRRALSLSLPRRPPSLTVEHRTTAPSHSAQEILPRANGTESPEQNSSSSNGSQGSVNGIVESPPTSPRLTAVLVKDQTRFAGNPSVYFETTGNPPSPFIENMIRDRVSIRGEIRPLEPESELTACTMPRERVGVVDELAVRRYIEGKTRWDERYARTYETIRKHRLKNLDIAKSETVRNVQQLQMHIIQDGVGHRTHAHAHAHGSSTPNVMEGLRKTAASWAWAWAIDDDERPPPSSIVARRDTEEARRLSKIADQPVTEDEQRLSGNRLWTHLINALSTEKGAVPGTPQNGTSASASEVAVNGVAVGSPRPPSEKEMAHSSTPPAKHHGKLRRFLSASAPVPKRALSSPPPVEEGQKSSVVS